jgi:uncharacterized membrane protein YheB (UPF0754 family)
MLTPRQYLYPVRTITHVRYRYGEDAQNEILDIVRQFSENKMDKSGVKIVKLCMAISETYRCSQSHAFQIIHEAAMMLDKKLTLRSMGSYRVARCKLRKAEAGGS